MMKRMAPFAVAAMAVGLLSGVETSRAAEADWTACKNTENHEAQIAACARIVDDEKESWSRKLGRSDKWNVCLTAG